MGIYIDPLTDYGFKRIFANEKHKNITIAFLNSILELESPIKKIEFNNLEKAGETEKERKSIFDIFCTDTEDREFIVELQRKSQEFFIDRSIYYMSRQIADMGVIGKWDYKIKPIYFIAILDFELFNDNRYFRKASFKDETGATISDKMNLIFIETKKFSKSIQDLEQRENWIYFLKNLETMNSPKFSGVNFDEAFEIAKYSKLEGQDRVDYEISLKEKRDFYSQEKSYKRELEAKLLEGLEQGEKRKQLEIAKNLLDILDVKTISVKTGLSILEIENLK